MTVFGIKYMCGAWMQQKIVCMMLKYDKNFIFDTIAIAVKIFYGMIPECDIKEECAMPECDKK